MAAPLGEPPKRKVSTMCRRRVCRREAHTGITLYACRSRRGRRHHEQERQIILINVHDGQAWWVGPAELALPRMCAGAAEDVLNYVLPGRGKGVVCVQVTK